MALETRTFSVQRIGKDGTAEQVVTVVANGPLQAGEKVLREPLSQSPESGVERAIVWQLSNEFTPIRVPLYAPSAAIAAD